MARKVTPRHVAKQEEAAKPETRPRRFNQKIVSDNPNLMHPLNSDISDTISPLLSLGVVSVERRIVEKVNEFPTIHLTAYSIYPKYANTELANFLVRYAENSRNQAINLALGRDDLERYNTHVSYEGTLYLVTDVDINEPEYLEQSFVDGTTRRTLSRDGEVVLHCTADPAILKIKEVTK